MDALKAVKFVDGTDDTIEGWAAPFDGPMPGGKDFDKENFSARTDFALNWFETRPVLFHHGFDAETGIAPVGRVKSHELKANGLWAQAQLDKSNAYWEDIQKLIAEGKLYFSSGALAHLTKKSADGEILVWPWVELSLTPTPANPYATLSATQAAKHFKSAGLATDDLRALGAEVEPDTRPEPTKRTIKATSFEALRELICAALQANPDVIPEAPDADETPAPMPMATMDDGSDGEDPTYVVATYPGYVVVNRCDMDDDGDGGFWRIDYTQNADGTVTLGTAVPVEQTYTPIGKSFTKSAARPPVVAAPAQIEAVEPTVAESTTVETTEIKAADAVVATTPDLNTDPDNSDAAIKSLRDEFRSLVAQLSNEPAVKAGGVAIPALAYSGLKADSAEEVKAFESYIRGGSPRGMKRSEWAAKAALNETTTTQGGFAVPAQYSMDLVVPLTNLSYLRNAGARIVNFSGTDAVHVPTLTYTAAAVLTSEATPYDEKEPTMGEVVFTPFKFTRLAKASEELAADSRFDLWGQILMPDFAQAYAATENTYFSTGTGTSQPQGIVAGSTTGVTSAATGAVTADEIIATYFALDYKYRPNAKWMMNDATIQAVRQLKDGQSRYLWSPGLDGSTQGELLGKPIVTNNSMATLAAAHDVVLFGDFSYFWIGQWAGLDIQRLTELYSASGQIGFRSFRRFDAHLMLSAAVTKLTTHA